MNNRWLLWQIRTGQASVEEADVLLCDERDACRQSKGRMLEAQTISTYCKSLLDQKYGFVTKLQRLSLNPEKREKIHCH